MNQISKIIDKCQFSKKKDLVHILSLGFLPGVNQMFKISSKINLLSKLHYLKANNKKIFAVGAPSRATTLVNFVGLNEDIIDCVCEVKGSHKINHYLPGTRIPIYQEDVIFKKKPDYLLLLSWHISSELILNLKKKGFKGKFIIPLPNVKII